MRSNRANLFRSAPPDRNASPAARRLGEDYTEERHHPAGSRGMAVDRGPNRQRKGITLRIDLENNIKAQQSGGLCTLGEARKI